METKIFIIIGLVLFFTLSLATQTQALLSIPEGNQTCIDFHVIDAFGNVDDAGVNITIYHNDSILEIGQAAYMDNGIYCYLSNTSWTHGIYTAQANVTFIDNNVSAASTNFKITQDDTDKTIAEGFMAGNEFVALLAAAILVFIFLIRNKVMMYRFIGSGMLYLIALGSIAFLNTEVMWVFAITLMAIATWKLIEDTTSLAA